MSGYHPRSDDADDSALKKRRMGDSARVNAYTPPPSRVVHGRSVPDGSLSTDMQASLLPFGSITQIMLLPKLRQALVEFETIDAAVKCVEASKESGVVIKDRPVYFNFSKSQEINRGQADTNVKPNKTLLFTVQNALYPITCDVLQAICQPIGAVLRIVMVRKRGVQALVEFDSLDSATKAKAQLNFADIYAGCCTLKIEFSRTETLNVTFNSDDTRDYTNPALPTREARPHGGPPMMGGQWNGGGNGQYDPRTGQAASGATDPWQSQQMGYPGGRGGPPGAYGGAQPMGIQGAPNPGGYQMPGSVIMFYDLSTKYFNCMRLFNLICLYANPIKIKFIVNKPGMAMCQVDDPYQGQMVTDAIQGLEVFGQKIECSPSKHPYIADSRNQARLPDGSPHTLDCARSMNHRFNTSRAGSQSKGPQSRPTPVLHFFNAPKDTPHSALIDLFKSHGAVVPQSILTLRPREGVVAKSDRGFVQFRNDNEAVDALVLCNHVEIQNPKGQIFTVKFAFSKSHIDENDAAATRPYANANASVNASAPPPNEDNTNNAPDAANPEGDDVQFASEQQ